MNESLIQGTPEWIALRKTCITSTDSSILLGINPWCTPLKLYLRKKGLIPDIESNAAMERGKALEEPARKWFEEKTANIMFPCVRFHKEHKFLMASLDGMTIEGDAIVEIKCPGEKTHALALQGEIPDYYMAQIQHQLLVTGLDMAYYVSFDGKDGVIIEIKRNKDMINQILKLAIEFHNCLINNTPPPSSEREYEEIFIDSQDEYIVQELLQTRNEIKRLEDKEDNLKKWVIQKGNGGNFRLCNKEGTPIIKAFQVPKEGSVDWKALCKDKNISNEDIEKYRKPSTTYYKVSES